jgi:hypothetical protein
VELQGGQIGVHSESGKGSTFAFYVETARIEAPVEPPAAQSAQTSSSDHLRVVDGPIARVTQASDLHVLGEYHSTIRQNDALLTVIVVEGEYHTTIYENDPSLTVRKTTLLTKRSLLNNYARQVAQRSMLPITVLMLSKSYRQLRSTSLLA